MGKHQGEEEAEIKPLGDEAESDAGHRAKREVQQAKNPDLKDLCCALPVLSFERICHAVTLFSHRAACTAESKRRSQSCTNSNGHGNNTNAHTGLE